MQDKLKKTVAQMVRDFSGVDLHAPSLKNQKVQAAESPKSNKKATITKPGGLKNIKAKNSNGVQA
jgi:hypothetical protein